MHNEHFMPVSKLVLYFQYGLFGMHHLLFQITGTVIHAVNAGLLYVLARGITRLRVPRLFGTLCFAFSGAYWEVTQWEAGQQTSLALLFILVSLIVAGCYLRTGGAAWLALTMVSALLASWSMGFGLLVLPLVVVQASASGERGKRGVAVCALPFAAILASIAIVWLIDPHGAALVGRRASVEQAMAVIPWTLTALKGLADSYLAPVAAPMALACLFLCVGIFFPRRFLSGRRLSALAMPIVMLLSPYALTAIGRVQLGMNAAASSRYQYIPAAGLGLIVVWVASGLFVIAKQRYPQLLRPLALVTLLTLPLHAVASYRYIGQHSLLTGWGEEAQRFVSAVVQRPEWKRTPPGMAYVTPELYLPNGMYPQPYFELNRALQLYPSDVQRPGITTVSSAAAFGSQEITRANLLNGGARGIVPGQWKATGLTLVTFDAAAENVPRLARIELTGPSGYGFDTRCSEGNPYTFAASVQLQSGEPATCMRMIFTDAAGRLLETFRSRPIISPDFETVAISGYPPPGSTEVTVDFSNAGTGYETTRIAVRDAVLVRHPVYVPATPAR